MYEEGTLDKKLMIIGAVLFVGLIVGLILLFTHKEAPVIKNYDSVTIKIGEKYKVNTKHIEKSLKKLEMISSDEEVATINSKAVVTGKNEGTTTIVIADKKYDYVTQDIIVKGKKDKKEKKEVSKIELKKNEIALFVNDSYDITELVKNYDELKDDLKYKTSDDKILSVTDKGIIKALKVGTSNIIISAGKDNEVICKVVTKNDTTNEEKPVSSSNKPKTNTTSGSNSNSNYTPKPTPTKKTVYPTTLRVSATSRIMYTNYPKISGNTFAIVASVLPSNSTNKTLRYSSNNNNVATVNARGIVTAKNPGTATITVATSNNIKKNITVYVKVVTRSLTPIVATNTVYKPGVTISLGTSFSPANTHFKALSWSSSNTSVATIRPNGTTGALASLNKTGATIFSVTTTNNPMQVVARRQIEVKDTRVLIAKGSNAKADKTNSTVSYTYSSSGKVNFNLNLVGASTTTLKRANYTVTSSSTRVLSCSSSAASCTMKKKGTSTLTFKYGSYKNKTVKVTLK